MTHGLIRSILNSTENANQFANIHLNINSIMSKLSYIEKLFNSNRLDVLVLQETKIDDVIPNNLLRFTNYGAPKAHCNIFNACTKIYSIRILKYIQYRKKPNYIQ
jgi:hypothetical protein